MPDFPVQFGTKFRVRVTPPSAGGPYRCELFTECRTCAKRPTTFILCAGWIVGPLALRRSVTPRRAEAKQATGRFN